MKKIFIMLLVLSLLISCGKGKDSKNSFDFKKNENKGSQQKNMNEIEKYNLYIGVYNDLLNLDKNINYYLEDAGNKEQFQQLSKNINASFPGIPTLLEKINKASSAKPSMAEVDKTSKALVPILEEFKPLAEDMKAYYDGKDYTADNYKKAQELHTKFIEMLKKYDVEVPKFRAEMRKVMALQKEKEAKELKKAGRVVSYNRMQFLSASEEIIEEIQNQNLNGANFISGDLSKFKSLQEKLIKAATEFQDSIKDTKQMEKEGYKSYQISSFANEVNSFKASVAEFIKRMEEKRTVSDSTLGNSFFLENETGTPENVYKEFNDLVNEYNRSNR